MEPNVEGQLQRLLARELHLTDEQQHKLRQQNRAMHRRSRKLEQQVHELRRDLLLESLKSGQGNAQSQCPKGKTTRNKPPPNRTARATITRLKGSAQPRPD
jgi:hypothetical protein